MANLLSVPQQNGAPNLSRVRSSSSPMPPPDSHKSQPAFQTARPRPTHTRSRSYMSPTDTKLIGAATFPTLATPSDKPEVSRFHRLHLPGRHHHSQSTNEAKQTPRTHHGRHRYTQSEAQQYQKKRDSALLKNDSPGTPLSTTTPTSSVFEHPNDLLYPSSRGAAIPSLIRMTSTRPHRGHLIGDIPAYANAGLDGRPHLRRRATSDTRAPPNYDTRATQLRTAPAPTKTPIELQLDQADLTRRQTLSNTTESDLHTFETNLASATTELHSRLYKTTRAASDLMRRLDDAQETLTRTTDSLIDTISSFTNLSDQSSQLLSNFEAESVHLDDETRHRITSFRSSICRDRSRRVEELEARGVNMGLKARDLERRLENCRTIVANWEVREVNKRKAWRGVWVGIGWGLLVVGLAVVVGVVSWKVAQINGRGVGEKDVLRQLRGMTVENASWSEDVVRELDVPQHVRDVLLDVYRRAEGGGVRGDEGENEKRVEQSGGQDVKSDKGLRLLDEL